MYAVYKNKNRTCDIPNARHSICTLYMKKNAISYIQCACVCATPIAISHKSTQMVHDKPKMYIYSFKTIVRLTVEQQPDSGTAAADVAVAVAVVIPLPLSLDNVLHIFPLRVIAPLPWQLPRNYYLPNHHHHHHHQYSHAHGY